MSTLIERAAWHQRQSDTNDEDLDFTLNANGAETRGVVTLNPGSEDSTKWFTSVEWRMRLKSSFVSCTAHNTSAIMTLCLKCMLG